MSDSSTVPVLPIVARARRGYCLRLLAVGFGMCAVSVWFAYDAAVAYPAHNAQHEVLEAFKAEHGDEASARWPAHAKANGHEPSFNTAENQKHTPMDILTQWGLGGVTLALGLWSLGGFALVSRRKVTWDGEALTDHRGVRISRARITAVDASRWEDRGIFVVRGTTEGGKPAAIELDDWKLETEAVEGIYKAVKAGV